MDGFQDCGKQGSWPGRGGVTGDAAHSTTAVCGPEGTQSPQLGMLCPLAPEPGAITLSATLKPAVPAGCGQSRPRSPPGNCL